MHLFIQEMDMRLTELIVQWILERKKAGPLLAAFDDVDTSGKTIPADAVAQPTCARRAKTPCPAR